MTASCEFCHRTNTIKLNNKIYCNHCEIYISSDKTPYILNLKSSNIPLCNKCNKKKNTKIHCMDFKDYLKKLPFCKLCLEEKKLDFKYNFFKHTLFYRRVKSLIKFYYFFIPIYFKNKIINFLFLLWLVRYIAYWRIVIFLILNYFLGNNLFCLILFCIYAHRLKVIYYEMPIYFDNFDLTNEFDKLRISQNYFQLKTDSKMHNVTIVKNKKDSTEIKVDKGVEDKLDNLKL